MKFRILITFATVLFTYTTQANPLPFETEFKLPSNVVEKSISKTSPLVSVLTNEKQAMVYNYVTGNLVASFEVPDEYMPHVRYIRMSPNGKYLAIVNYWSPQVVVFNTLTGKKVLVREFTQVSGGIAKVKFDPKEEVIAIADPFIVDGAIIKVVNLTSGTSKIVGYSVDSGEEGFYDLEFFYLNGKRALVTLSYYACRLSVWDMDDNYAEKKVANNCSSDIELADEQGNYLLGEHNSLEFFNIFNAQKVSTVHNYYEYPHHITIGSFFSYGFFNSSVIFLGDGPGLKGIFLRSIDYKTNQDIFTYDISGQGFSSLRVIKNTEKDFIALIGRDKISTVNIENL